MKRLGALLGAALLTTAATAGLARPLSVPRLPPGTTAWRDTVGSAVRGVTVGPIESALHPGRGYGSEPCERTMAEIRRLGGNWVSLTPFGRVWSVDPEGVSLTFEEPFAHNRTNVARAVAQAHAAGLRVLLVPHLWMETPGWRGEIEPGDEAEWKRWTDAYRRFVVEWAHVAEKAGVDLFAVGVELRSWVTTTRAPSFFDVIADIRRAYSGPLTYAANWDDVEDTVILGELDVIGVNAFFRLSEKPGATPAELREGGERVAARVRTLAETWQKPVVFTEIGYTTRSDPAYEPWLWPDSMSQVTLDQRAQADAYEALLAPLTDEPWFAGFFVWRFYADPDDLSQEAEWGFSPRGKLAELPLRDAFATHWAGDGPRQPGAHLGVVRAERPGLY